MKKEIRKIEFEDVKKEIESIFPVASMDRWDLLPDSIHQLASTEGIDLVWKKIPQWTDFEYGRIDFTEKEFIDFAFYGIKPEGTIYLVTDTCFRDRKAYILDAQTLQDFAENIYDLDSEESFVQPRDYIFVNPNQKMITMIHHEGQASQYRRWF